MFWLGSKMPDKKKKKRVSRYPSTIIIKADTCDLAPLKKRYGGGLPEINGRKHKYPSKTDEKGWKVIYAQALTFRNKERYCAQTGCEPPVVSKARRSKYEYLLYHGGNKDKKARSERNKARKEAGLKKGDSRVVHHTDPDNIHGSRTIKLTHCQHHAVHGRSCKK